MSTGKEAGKLEPLVFLAVGILDSRTLFKAQIQSKDTYLVVFPYTNLKHPSFCQGRNHFYPLQCELTNPLRFGRDKDILNLFVTPSGFVAYD